MNGLLDYPYMLIIHHKMAPCRPANVMECMMECDTELFAAAAGHGHAG